MKKDDTVVCVDVGAGGYDLELGRRYTVRYVSNIYVGLHGLSQEVPRWCVVRVEALNELTSAAAVANKIMGGGYSDDEIDVLWKCLADRRKADAKDFVNDLLPGDRVAISNMVTPKRWAGKTGQFVRKAKTRAVIKMDSTGEELRVPISLLRKA